MSENTPLVEEYFLNGTVTRYNLDNKVHASPSIVFATNALVSAPILASLNSGWKQPIGAVYDSSGQLIEQSRMRALQELPKHVELGSGNKTLKGKYLYLGYYNEVYGHFILETLARLWACDVVDLSDREFIFHSMHGNEKVNKGYIRDVLESFGIAESKIHIVKDDVIVEDILVPSSLSYIGDSQHPEIKNTFLKVHGDAVDPDLKVSLYISRANVKKGNHRFINEEAIEHVFEQFGFIIVRPEEMPLAEQIMLYRSAEVVAGPLSSALHNSVFCKDGTKVIALNGRWNGKRPDVDQEGKSIKTRSVQDFICRNYNQPIHYIESQKAFLVEGQPPGRMPYWIDEQYLAETLAKILKKDIPESVTEISSTGDLSLSVLDSLSEYSESKKYKQLENLVRSIRNSMSNDSLNLPSTKIRIMGALEVSVDLLPNAQEPYSEEVQKVRERLNAQFSELSEETT